MAKKPISDAKEPLQQAIGLYRTGDYAAAERLCRKLVRQKGARDGMAWHLLGAVLRDTKRSEEAEACFRTVVELDPANADAFANLGLCCADQGRLDEGIDRQRQALAIMPQHNAALLNLGTLLFQANRFADARQAFERAEKNGRSGAVVRGLAACSKKLGQSLEAVGMYRRWLAEHPDDIAVITELGLTLLELYRWNEAKEALELGRALAPASVPILANLGTVYRTMFKYAAALEVWEAARALEPDKPEVLVNLGSLYRDLGRTREAEVTLRRAIELRPDYANAHNNLGNVFRDEGRTQEAREAFLKCLEFDQQHWCAWSNLLFTSQNIGGLAPELLAQEARRFGEALRTAGIAGGKRHANDASPERRLRIGYLSPDFLTHSVSYFIEPILQHHDRNKVHVTCFANQSAIDPMTQRLQQLADNWHFVEDLSDDQLEALIEAQRIDILVDLAGHTAKNRLPLLARQVAPVQATWIGYPDTTGLAGMNYRLTDVWADPVGKTDAWHTEKLIRLPQGFLCYRPLPDAPEPTDPPCLVGGAVTFGSFNSLSKVDPSLIALWSRLLQTVPGSRLMLKSLALDAAGCREFYLQAFAEQGIERSRLTLIGKIPTMREHLAKYGEVDIALDTYPYHGTTTTCEALWMGVPVITLAGLRHVSRVGVSLLSQVGAIELIARDEAHYVALAVELARDPQRLRTYRHSLRGMMASSPLCDAAGKTAAVEAAFRQMWRDWCAAASQSEKAPAAPTAAGGSSPAADAAAGGLFLRLMDKGRVGFESGNWPEAAAAFREAAMLEPAAADAWANQGAALKSMGKVDEALACYRKSLELKPDSAMVYSNMGAALLNKGDIDAAEKACRQSLMIDPDYAKGYVNLALVHASKRNNGEALTAYERALELGLESAETYCNMGASLFELGRLEEAVACCEKALLLKPSFTDARANLSTALIGQGRLAEGLAEVRTVLEQRPGFALANSNLLMTMQYDDTVTSAELYNAHREWGLRFGGQGGGFDFRGREEADRRLRLGFVSTDFNAHPVGFFLEPLLSRLDRRAVEIFLYAANAHSDPVTDRLLVLADHWRLIVGLDAEAAARLVYDDRIDILFDLNGHTRGNRLDMFALRPAPLQVTWLGYPDTTGLPEMDIRLSDRHADPEGKTEQYCTERLVRLPQSFLCYQMMPGAPAVSPAPCLAGGGVTFGSFNNLSKISPTAIRLWSRLLLPTAGTRLLVKAKALTDEGTRRRLRAAFAKEGLGEERIELRGWTPGPLGHLDQYKDVDIALDTFPYHGATTTCEALSMGVPVVTLAGVRHASRVGASILNCAGLAEMVAADENEYIDIAVRLSQDRERLARLREGMRERLKTSPLCDATRFARDFAEACRQMWREWRATSSGDKQLTSPKDYAMQSVPQQKILRLPIADHTPIRLHLGGKQAKPGWKILNIQAGPNVDFVGSITDLSQFSDASVAEIYGSHVLEHVSYATELLPTLKGFWRALVDGGRLMISVPDLERLSRLFISSDLGENQKYHVMRMMFGGQVDEYDLHKTGFSYEILASFLAQAGFVEIRRVDQFGIFEDTSNYAPYGVPISLNIEARKSGGRDIHTKPITIAPIQLHLDGKQSKPGRKLRILIVMARQTKMGTYHLPLGIGYVSASLKRAGHEVRVLNPNHSTEEIGPLLTREIREFTPEVLAFGGMAFHLNQVRHAVATARPLLPHAVIIIGGTLVTNQPDIAMAAIPEANIGVVGEGEQTVVELISALETGNRLDAVNGLIYWDLDRKLKRTPMRPIQENLDEIPWVDWEGVGLDIYAGLHGPGQMAPGLIVEPGARVMPFMTSRGCPYSCTFCCHEIAGRRYRTRSLDDVFAELEYTIDRFGINTVCIFDDIFCLKRQRLKEFCERIRPLNLRWECSLRVEQITPANLRLMKESGMVCVSFGVESMSATVLNSMQKRTKPKALDRALTMVYEAKLTTWANLIFGDPAETMATAKESLEWMARNNHYDLRTAFIGFHPGSRIYKDAVKNGLISDPLTFILAGIPEINATTMTDQEYQHLKNVVVPDYVVSFGMPGRIVEHSQTASGNYDIRFVCPHCNTELSYLNVNINPHIIARISCKACNQLFRIPVRFRKNPTKELEDLHNKLRGLLQATAGTVSQANAGELLSLCQRINLIDRGNDKIWALQIKILDSFGNLEQVIESLRQAIWSNPYNPELFDQMSARLTKLGRDEDAVKYVRQAALLRRLGMSGPVDVPWT